MALEFLGPEVTELAAKLPEIQTYLKICDEKGIKIIEEPEKGIGGCLDINYYSGIKLIKLTKIGKPIDILSSLVHEFTHYKNRVGRFYPMDYVYSEEAFMKFSMWDEKEAYSVQAKFLYDHQEYPSDRNYQVVCWLADRIEDYINETTLEFRGEKLNYVENYKRVYNFYSQYSKYYPRQMVA